MSNQPFSPEITFTILEKYGVTLAAYYVMCAVGYEIFQTPERLAQTSFNHAEGDPRGEVTVSEHLNAIYRCVKKGWLEILTAEQCEREMARQESSPTIEFVDLLEPGAVSFTQKGYLLFRQIILESLANSTSDRWILFGCRR